MRHHDWHLWKWRQHPDAAGYIKQAFHSNIEKSHGVITGTLPMLTVRLVELGLSSEVKPYAQTVDKGRFAACLKCFLSPLVTPEGVWEENFLDAGGDVACF